MAKGTKPEQGGDGAPKAAGKAGGEEEVVIRVPVHCDGCGRKLRRSLQRIDGVGEVSVDSNTNTVVVRGGKAVENAREAVRIVEKRTGRKAVLLSPAPEKLPPPPAKGGDSKKRDDGNKDMNELPEIDMKMVVILRMNLHCDACCEEIKRRILRIKGVEDVVPHLKSSQMMVKGTVEPATLVGFIHKCTGRKAAIFRAEPLDPLPPPPKSPPPEATEAKKDNPTENTSDEKNKQDDGGKKEEEPQEETKGVDEEDKQKPADGDSGAAAEGKEEDHSDEAGKDTGAGDGVVVEEHKKDDHLFASVPLPAGVVTVPAPADEAAVSNVARYYYAYPSPSYYTYAHPSSYYQYQQQYPQPYYQPYPYACGGPGMYGYPQYPPEAFTEENPSACAIV
ncbi:unnamed protein product [Urochloa humidicola]